MHAAPNNHPRFPSPSKPRARRSFASLRSIGALMLREMATTYGRSPGGYLWAIIEPVAGIAILTFAFGFLFAFPPIGTSFELFHATGMLPFLMFTTITSRVSTCLIFSKPLLIYPAVTFVDAIIARFAVTLITELMVCAVVLCSILTLYDTRTTPDLLIIVESLSLTAVFALAVGTLNAYLFMRWHVWHIMWSILTRPLFLISGVFFTYDALPRLLQDVLWYNPLIHIVGIMRSGFYPSYSADYTSHLYVTGVSLVALLAGLQLLRWFHTQILHS